MTLRDYLIGVLSSGVRVDDSPVLLARVEEHDDWSVTLHLLVGPDRWEVRIVPPEARVAARIAALPSPAGRRGE